MSVSAPAGGAVREGEEMGCRGAGIGMGGAAKVAAKVSV